MSTLKDKYVNPLTDFGFKKLFGTELNKILLQDRVFQKLFEAAEIARFSPEEREAYEDSLKYYRDMKNVVDTSHEEGILEGIEKGILEGIEKRNIEIAKRMKEEEESIEKIMRYTNLSKEEIDGL